MDEDLKETRAENILRTHLTGLTRLIVAAGLREFVDECESRGLVTASVKETLVSTSTGKTDSDRASSLVDNIRRSLGIDPQDVMDDFLCVVFIAGGRNGQALAKQLAKEYRFPLSKLAKVVEDNKRSLIAASSSSKGSSSKAPVPVIRDLTVNLRNLVHWEAFAQHLPEISNSDIQRIKIENSHDIEGQKMALYDKWVRADASATWEAVVKALEICEEGGLAKKIREKFKLVPVPATDTTKAAVSSSTSSEGEETDSNGETIEASDASLDQKKLYNKVPILKDVLSVVPKECDNKKFREELKLPMDKMSFEEAIKAWIDQETTPKVTWLTLIQALKNSGSVETVRFIAATFLRRPSVYQRYISTCDYESLDDLI